MIPVLLGLAATLVFIVLYEDWWAIVFSVGGATIAILQRRGSTLERAVAVGGVVTVSLAIASMGGFLVFMSQFGCAHPDVPCPSPPPTLLGGIAALVVAAIGVGLAVWHVAHGSRRDPQP